METTIPQPNPHQERSSYRTYEEWKPNVKLEIPNKNIGSYRTYEEWKPAHVVSHKPVIGSYRTYEEWKPVFRESFL